VWYSGEVIALLELNGWLVPSADELPIVFWYSFKQFVLYGILLLLVCEIQKLVTGNMNVVPGSKILCVVKTLVTIGMTSHLFSSLICLTYLGVLGIIAAL
jgi:hypothetical protein